MKKIDLILCISLMVIAIGTLIFSISNIMGIDLPKIVSIIIAIIEVVALPFLLYSSIKKLRNIKND